MPWNHIIAKTRNFACFYLFRGEIHNEVYKWIKQRILKYNDRTQKMFSGQSNLSLLPQWTYELLCFGFNSNSNIF